MHILITDSGVGGLSVCAYAERLVRTRGFPEPVRLTFANAAPENDYGYNSMPTRAEKLETFDRFLRRVNERFTPDSIYVACNTLSVLLADTPFAQSAALPVRGIVETGVALVLEALRADPTSRAIIFGTQTTIDAGAYPRLLRERGVDASRIISQACPGLADTISEDREGLRTAAEIRHWVGAALAQRPASEAPVVAALACTHYGYRADLFRRAFEEEAVTAIVVNPNEAAAGELVAIGSSPAPALMHDVSVEFVTRYAIPAATVEALTWFLKDISPRTVEAMQRFVHLPELF